MRCALCSDEWPDADGGVQSFVDHLRVMHPDQEREVERWPDGSIVLHDDTLEPKDFQ